MGSNLLMVGPGKRLGPGRSADTVPFKQADVEAIAREIHSVAAVAPVASQSVQAIFGNQNWSTQVTGSDNQYFRVTNRTIQSGRSFHDSELRGGAAVCIIGQTVRQKLFGGQNALGEKIRLEKFSCEVIGLLEGKGQSTMGMDQDDIVVIPRYAPFQRRIAGNQDIRLIQVSVRDGASTEKAQQDITRLLRERRHLSPSDDDNFHVMDMKEIANMLTGTTQLLTALLSARGPRSASLSGGIGIMNIMLVDRSPSERERSASGWPSAALEGEVLMQFLVEAVVLSSFGGLIGIVLALSASFWLTGFLNVPFVFNAGIVIIAFLFSGAVGVIFGYFPALKASRLDPIEALRHE